MNYKHWTIETDAENICWLHLDVADSSTNVLSSEVLIELNQALDELVQSPPTRDHLC